MREEAIEQKLQLGEDSLTEFKGVARTGFLMDAKDLAKAIGALANTRGGHVILGVEKDGTPTGVGTVQQADALMLQVSQVCSDGIHPAVVCVVQKVLFRGAPLLVIEVPEFSADRPYRAHNIYYVRDGNRSRQATRDELVRLLQSQDHHFDEQPVASATIIDLDETAVSGLLHGLYSSPPSGEQRTRYLRALKCIDATGTPTVTGVLLLGQEPSRWLPDARVTAVRFPGLAVSSDFVDRQEIEGRLMDQVDRSLSFLARHIWQPSHVEGARRVEEGIPPLVLREALSNAIAHRDYRAASQVRLLVFDDRVEIINPGQLLNQLTLDSIRLGGISQRRNPVIASLLARAAGRENTGIGVPEMIRLMAERGLPEPEFGLEGGHFRLVLRTCRTPG